MYSEKSKRHGGSVSDGLYGLGFIGALVFYLQHATSLVAGLIGIGKALVWPAFLVYNLLAYLKM
ncbi:MAG: hypothetical protein GXY49_04105 [Syntrophomonadaceae bacterium]|jgi:hypothetical protein|nr:hypothetical protein [Syntrophomonadaceae bacterium]